VEDSKTLECHSKLFWAGELIDIWAALSKVFARLRTMGTSCEICENDFEKVHEIKQAIV